MARDIEAGNAFVRLSVRGASLFSRGLAAAKATLAGFGKAARFLSGHIRGLGKDVMQGVVTSLKMFAEQGKSPAARNLANAFKTSKEALSSFALTLGEALAPAATKIMHIFTQVIGVVQDWIKENGFLVDTLTNDLGMAGQIAMAALRTGFLQGIDALDNLVTASWQKISEGLALMFGMSVTEMTETLDSFANGIVDGFRRAARFAVDAWRAATIQISKWLLRIAEQSSAFGRAALGVDVKAERERERRLNEAFAARGGPGSVFDLEGTAAGQLDKSADKIKTVIDSVAEAGKKGFAGLDLSDEIAKSQADLDKLMARAKEDAKRRANELVPGAADAAKKAGGGEATATFSAAAAILMGGGGVQQRIAKAAEDTRKIASEQLAALNEIKRGLNPGFG